MWARKPWQVAAGIFAVSATITCAFFINFCNFVFRCGCRALWAGADLACNIHSAHGKHCPWCSHGWTGYAIVLAFMLIPQAVISIQSTRNPWLRLILAVGAFPIGGAVAALGFGLIDGYWSA
ncbi:MAG: hypothetical protein ABI823_04325 [Bryobacteraceae bacterium]